MEEGNIIRPSPLRPGGSLKSPSSGKSSPRGSPSFRRLNSVRTPRRESKPLVLFGSHCFRSNRVVLWLLLITLWAYAGFYFQSRWAHGDNKENLFSGGYGGENIGPPRPNERDLIANINVDNSSFRNVDVNVSKKASGGVFSSKNKSTKKKSKRSARTSRKKSQSKPKVFADESESEIDFQMDEIPKQNTTYGFLVGPFGSVEDSVLEWSPEKRRGTCDRKGAFARLVWSRKFVLIFHELSMTGAPLAMMELATEFLSCGATVSVIVLSRKGGLMTELVRRKIKVLEDKTDLSFKTAMKADLIIAGSAVCSNWIENYLSRTVLGSSQIMWWIMENRREYFNRTMPVLNRVKKLIFLSQSQSKQWLDWCQQENIQLKSEPALIPLSVNDELAFAAGIPSSLNTPSFTTQNMLERKQLLRNAVRKEMGLADSDMLAITLSSINSGKGQLLLLESARLMIENGPSVDKSGGKDSIFTEHDYYSRGLLGSREREGGMDRIKILIGSVGSKSNKVLYVKTLLRYLAEHSNLSRSVLWTPATTRVASLYAAADAYVMNSQGLGETFGRVTIEAMAFGLPVLGTDSGGTKEIVEHNVTGLLHPLGRPGAQILARNLEFLLKNRLARQEMGMRGREKVEKMYLKKHMFQKFGEVLYKSMRIK
ncbi:glycosyltransferase [Striga asiatica]|uniref:Glycosyltransferase n=1 Tax=Striga asiatica TaxID=4170 RepID=A0A5A7QTU1_STRAF|nr:glycosyltransferase [Striga asiatica]